MRAGGAPFNTGSLTDKERALIVSRTTWPGASLIAMERSRQITAEGWSKDHDAEEHDTGELGLAAAAYALEAVRPGRELNRAIWPWDESWWKPKDDPIRNLVRAGALIAAEIDRLQRDA